MFEPDTIPKIEHVFFLHHQFRTTQRLTGPRGSERVYSPNFSLFDISLDQTNPDRYGKRLCGSINILVYGFSLRYS